MRERGISAILAMIAVLLALGLLLPKDDEAASSMPHSEDRGEQGLAVLYQWLNARNFPVSSYRNRWSNLLESYPSGNVLLSHAPYREQNPQTGEWRNASNGYLDAREKRDVLRWIAAGNTVVFALDALDAQGQTQEARSSARSDIPYFDVLKAIGWQFSGSATASDPIVEESIAASSSLETPIEPAALRPQALHRLRFRLPGQSDWQNVETLAWEAQGKQTLLLGPLSSDCEAPSDLDDESDIGVEPTTECQKPLVNQALVLLQSARDESAAGWYLPLGRGGVVVLGYSSMWRNPNINAEGSAAFAENLLAKFVQPSGVILFDDYRYGLSERYDPAALKRDPRLYQSLAIAGLLWLIYAIARNRQLLPARVPKRRVSSAGFASRIAELYARHLSPAEQTQLLLHHFYQQCADRYGLSADHPDALWPRLLQDQTLDEQPLSQLHALRHSTDFEHVNQLCVQILQQMQHSRAARGAQANSLLSTESIKL